MSNSIIKQIGKAIAGTQKPVKKAGKQRLEGLKVENVFKTRESLNGLTEAEKTACDIFSLFYGNVSGAIQIREESLPLTTYANCLWTLFDILENDPAPGQQVAALWGKMKIADTPRAYKSEFIKCKQYIYCPNFEHEKILVFAGLMVVVKLAFQDQTKTEEIVKSIRTIARSKENLAYFAPFDREINTFNPDEVSVSLKDAVNAVKSATKPYKALAIYEFLCSQFQKDEAVISFIKTECGGIEMNEPETGTRIENVNVTDGGTMAMIDNSTIHGSHKELPSSNPQNLLTNANQ